jgi:hypothetical protein
MADYVLNEWLWHDCFGDNGDARTIETIDAMVSFIKGSDRLLVVRDSPFFGKWAALSKSPDLLRSRFAGVFKTRLLWDDLRCLLFNSEDLPGLPDALRARIKDDDSYLVRLLLKQNGSILVTTDVPLRHALGAKGLPCEDRAAFVMRFHTP